MSKMKKTTHMNMFSVAHYLLDRSIKKSINYVQKFKCAYVHKYVHLFYYILFNILIDESFNQFIIF